jgi:hypothetical protein
MGDAFTQYKMGLNHGPAYMVSGIPFVTGNLVSPSSSAGATPLEVAFPFVTQRIIYQNHGGIHVRIGFSANGVKTTNNFYLVEPSGSIELRIKTDKLYLLSNSAAANVVSGTLSAELTGIPSREYPLVVAYSGATGIG